MTPQGKAKELFNSFYIDCMVGASHTTARTLALMCVDEIIKANPVKGVFESYGPHVRGVKVVYESSVEYWQKVKEELQKL